MPVDLRKPAPYRYHARGVVLRASGNQLARRIGSCHASSRSYEANNSL